MSDLKDYDPTFLRKRKKKRTKAAKKRGDRRVRERAFRGHWKTDNT